MTISESIFSALSGNEPVGSIVGNRIFPVRPEQGQPAPYIIFQQIAGDPGNSHNEASGATLRLFQFACFATTYEGAVDLRDKVIAALDDVDLANGDSPSLDDERDGDFDDAAGLFRADADFLV